MVPCPLTPTSSAWFGSNNQVEDPNDAAKFDYDTRGNQTVMGTGTSLGYDGENRQTTFTFTGLSKELYSYDGEGRRVKHEHQVYSGGSYNTTATTVYVYDAKGRLAAEYGAASSSAPCGTCYLTADTLGSTRLMTDQSGAAVARYDYLPFGKEIPASSSGGRAGVLCGAASCYGQTAAASQKFTAKERDTETGLDYFGARYFSSAGARFTSPDPLLNSGRPWNPQSWNRYTYVLNNPLRFIDPDGLYEWAASNCNTDDDKCRKQYEQSQQRFRDALTNLGKARDSFKAGSSEYNRLDTALKAYGAEGEANGVAVGFGKLGGNIEGQVSAGNPAILASADGRSGIANVLVTFDPSSRGNSLTIAVAHEGQHVLDRQTFVGAAFADPNAFSGPLNLTRYQTEFGAYQTGVAAARGLGISQYRVGGYALWNSSWSPADRATLESTRGINNVLRNPRGNYRVTPENPGSRLYPQ